MIGAAPTNLAMRAPTIPARSPSDVDGSGSATLPETRIMTIEEVARVFRGAPAASLEGSEGESWAEWSLGREGARRERERDTTRLFEGACDRLRAELSEESPTGLSHGAPDPGWTVRRKWFKIKFMRP